MSDFLLLAEKTHNSNFSCMLLLLLLGSGLFPLPPFSCFIFCCLQKRPTTSIFLVWFVLLLVVVVVGSGFFFRTFWTFVVKHRNSQILPATNICSSEKSCEMQRKCFSYCGVPYFESLEDGVIEQLTELCISGLRMWSFWRKTKASMVLLCKVVKKKGGGGCSSTISRWCSLQVFGRKWKRDEWPEEFCRNGYCYCTMCLFMVLLYDKTQRIGEF